MSRRGPADGLRGRGVRDAAVLRAVDEVPPEAFPPPERTLSQAWVVALMCQAAAVGPEDRVLEVGTGSGYAAAVLSRLAGEVYTVERDGTRAGLAARRLEALRCGNVQVVNGDGVRGWAEHAPYDTILVSVPAPAVSADLVAQLTPRGRLVFPAGDGRRWKLLRLVRGFGGVRAETLDGTGLDGRGARGR